jgi:4-oxalocrotonate tautomerase
MPHIHIQIAGLKSDEEKTKLAEEVTKAVIKVAGSKEGNITVRIEDVNKSDWIEKVYKPDILAHWDELYKKPGYDPL